MTPERWRRVKEIALVAMDLNSDKRAEFIRVESGGDVELRASVERLLVADAKADDAFERAIAAAFLGLLTREN